VPSCRIDDLGEGFSALPSQLSLEPSGKSRGLDISTITNQTRTARVALLTSTRRIQRLLPAGDASGVRNPFAKRGDAKSQELSNCIACTEPDCLSIGSSHRLGRILEDHDS
jgi:hypothetical protein